MTIPGPTSGNLIDTVDQLVTAANSGSGGVPDSRISVFVDVSGQSCATDAITVINGFVVDVTIGSDISLNGDGFTVDIATEGTYLCQGSIGFNGDNGNNLAATLFLITGSSGLDGSSTPDFPGHVSQSVTWVHLAAGATIRLAARPRGGVGPDTVQFGGIDIVRIN